MEKDPVTIVIVGDDDQWTELSVPDDRLGEVLLDLLGGEDGE